MMLMMKTIAMMMIIIITHHFWALGGFQFTKIFPTSQIPSKSVEVKKIRAPCNGLGKRSSKMVSNFLTYPERGELQSATDCGCFSNIWHIPLI